MKHCLTKSPIREAPENYKTAYDIAIDFRFSPRLHVKILLLKIAHILVS